MTWKPKISFSLRALRESTGGNVMAIAAASVLPMLAIVGGTIDMSRAYMAQAQLQSACDAGVLAGRRALGRSGSYGTSEKGKATTMFNANFEPAKLSVTQSSFDTARASNDDITGTATARLPTMIMGVFNFQKFDLGAECRAELQLANTDVMFILDTTGSMAGSPLTGLQQAVRDFHSTLASARISPQTRVRYGFVPYSTTVNAKYLLQQNQLPASYFGTEATYSTRESEFNTPATQFVEWTGDATYGPNEQKTYYNSWECDGNGAEWSNDYYNSTTTGNIPNQVVSWYERVSYNSYYDRCTRRKVSRPAKTRRIYEFTQYVYHETPVSTDGLTGFDNVSIASHSSNAYVTTAGTYDMRELAQFNSSNSGGISVGSSSWNGCVMERATVDSATWDPIPNGARDLDIVSAPQSGVAESYWAPLWSGIMSYRGTYGPQYTRSLYDQPTGGWAACPQTMRAFQTVSMASTTVPNWVETFLTGLNAEGSTYHDIGMIWGARLASPRGIMGSIVNDQPEKSATRHIIFMTDGKLEPNNYGVNSYGLEIFANRVAPQQTNNADLATRHSARFRAACNLAKNEGYTIWVVAFGTSITSDMTTCATGDRVFFAGDNAQLRSQFQTIASQIADLRLGA